MIASPNKRHRTREAILSGARALMARGEPVSVAAAAAEEGISRATAYRYFSDPQVLASEAGLAVEVLPYETVISGAKGPRARTMAVSRYIFDLSVKHEAAFRQFLARNLDMWLAEGPGDRRGARRVEMFNNALQGAGLSKERQARLVNALAAATGSEAMIALHDVVQVDTETARAAVEEIAEALLDRFGVKE